MFRIFRQGALLAVLAALTPTCVTAAEGVPVIPPAPTIAASSFLLMDADTQKILVSENPHESLPPASLTKIMTSYVAAEELHAGRIRIKDQVPVSVKAWRTPGSRMFIKEGTQVTLEDLLRGVIIQSGNDASVAIAEHVAGSEDAFADMMNQQAALLGMTDSHFRNATGLPAADHLSSAWDLALLTKALIEKHPDTYSLYSERSFTFGGIEQPNRNRLLWRDRNVDGVKTGHTNAAGYCLVASAVRNDMRLISVVMGTKSDEARMRESQKLLSYGFRYFETQTLYDADVALTTPTIYYGETDTVPLGLAEKAVITFPRGHYKNVKAELVVPKQVEAPLTSGQTVGELILTLHDEVLYRAPLVALQDVPEGGMFSRLGDFVGLLFSGLFGGE